MVNIFIAKGDLSAADNECNHLLGNHLKLLTQLISDIQGLTNLVDLVKKARNKYEIYNGRAKEY